MRGKRLLLWLPLVLLLAIQLGPVLVIVLTSFKTQLSLLDQAGVLSWTGFSLENYVRVLVEDDFLTYVWTSTRIAVLSTLASVLLATPAAFALTRIQFPGRKMLAATILCSRMIPPVALAIPVFLLLGAMGATDSEPGLILAHMTFNLPFAVWLMLPFFDSIPRDFENAATMDGAKELQVFWHIMVPMALPGMLVTSIFSSSIVAISNRLQLILSFYPTSLDTLCHMLLNQQTQDKSRNQNDNRRAGHGTPFHLICCHIGIDD